jgi:hypothetical protein
MTQKYKVTISPEVLLEIVRAATWWREQRPASPRLFQTELDQALNLIYEYPEIGTVARSRRVANARILQLSRSRYLVFYQVLPRTRDVLA